MFDEYGAIAAPAGDIDYIVNVLPKNPTNRHRLSKEDELYVWCLALKINVVGKLSPVQKKGWGSRTEYAVLVDDTNAVACINSVSDLPPLSVDNLRAIVKRFKHLNPPYQS